MASLGSSPPRHPTEQTKRSTNHLPVKLAYDRWAAVYDVDGNFLQALDDRELTWLLPDFLTLLPRSSEEQKLRIMDLGCGTGRNTVKLLKIRNARVTGLDVSLRMLERAESRCYAFHDSLPPEWNVDRPRFKYHDMIEDEAIPQDISKNFQGVISTLVLEHIPLSTFFRFAWNTLAPGGVLLVTNMHSDMGAISQAGFLDPLTEEKVQTISYIHQIRDVIAESEKIGFERVSGIHERKVEQEMLEALGQRAKKWDGIQCWFGMIFKKPDRIKRLSLIH
ncbi:MAG: hypothetical protein MMC33_007002 [Icmadophila ericetorum]|nr:hypothetical protein [Icmadophila ericetorum]